MKAGLRFDATSALACVALALALGLLAAPASAASLTFAEGAEKGGFHQRDHGAGQVSNPQGVATDPRDGDLYLADLKNGRIDRFDAQGSFELAWGAGVADGKSEALQRCGPESGNLTSRCFGAPSPSISTPGALSPLDIAVDPTSGDVYVSDPFNRRVSKFSPAGKFIFMVGRNVNLSGAGQAERDICTAQDVEEEDECGAGEGTEAPGEYFASLGPLAVDSARNLWVGDGPRIVILDPSGHFLSEAALPEERTATDLALNGAADRLYAVEPGVREKQEVTFEGFEAGDSFTLGNLPASCSASSTNQIEYAETENPDTGEVEFDPGQTLSNVYSALAAECGSGNVGYLSIATVAFLFSGELAATDIPQLTCTSATGSCSVETLGPDGAPSRIEALEPAGGPPSSFTPLQTIEEGAGGTAWRDFKAIALGASGNLYVGERPGTGAAGLLRVFEPEGGALGLASQFGAGQVAGDEGPYGIAVGEAAGYLYSDSAGNETGAEFPQRSYAQRFELPAPGPLIEDQGVAGATPLGEGAWLGPLPTAATLEGTVNPEGAPTTYRFEWGTSASYGHSTAVEELSGEEYESEAVEAQLTGLLPDTTYHFRLCAENEAVAPESNCGPDATVTTRTAIGIEAQWVSALAARSATLNAQLDPLGAEAPSWWVQYGTGGALDHESAHQPLPATPGAVSVTLSGLEPATTYSYRFIARGGQEGASYEVPGETRTFTTQPAGLGLSLPDGRAWEMVSPPDKHGGRIRAFPEGAMQAAADGEALAYLSLGSLEADPEGSRLIEASSELSRRAPGGQWSSRDITLPHSAVTHLTTGTGYEYKLFSADLDRALLEPRDFTPLSPAAGERTPYVRENSEPPAYTPLLTSANALPGFGGDPTEPVDPVSVRAGTSDLSEVVVKVTKGKVTLLLGASEGALYVWAGGSLEPLSVLPDSGGVVSAELGAGEASLRGALSHDGTRAFFSAGPGAEPKGHLYVRDTARGETVQLDEVREAEGAFGTGEVEPLFQAATPDGRYAFFTDTQNLTADANETGADLYRCEVVIEWGHLKCLLSDLSAHTENPEAPFESAEVQGMLPGIGADGQSAFLVARGVLDAEPNSRGESAAPGQPNLYAWRAGEGMSFIAGLSEGDGRDWGVDVPFRRDSALSAAASPSGDYLAFMSERPLSGYDNRDATSGEPAEEVFRYDAVADALACVSCRPSGARPRALVPDSGEGQLGKEFDPDDLWVGRYVAALLPEASGKLSVGGPSTHRPRAVHDDGRVFFNAADSLVAADSNGDGDVYEYEPHGVGDCNPSSSGAATAQALEGGACVSLISSGHAEGTAAFLDASESGADVFFYTPAPLSVTDKDSESDIYDARVGGEPATLSPLAECQGEACQPPVSAPEATTPASATFRGPGNAKEKGASRCARPARKARRLSRRAKKLRRAAGRLARRDGAAKARRSSRRARRLAARAGRQSRQAGRCRRRASKGKGKSARSSSERSHARHDHRSRR